MDPKWLALGLLMGLQTAGSKTTYQADTFTVTVFNYDNTTSGRTNGETRVHFVGAPVKLVSPEMGIVGQSNVVDINWAQTELDAIEFRHGLLQGAAEFTMDTEAGFMASLEFASKHNKPAPIAPPVFNVYKFGSELLTYNGTIKKGDFDFPKPWTFDETSKGITDKKEKDETVHVNFIQTLSGDGVRGHFTIGTDPKGHLNQVQTGVVEGPAHFKLVRHETVVGAATTETKTYVGAADHVEINLTTDPGSIVATGHVTIHSESDGVVSDSSADRAVLTVSKTLEPLSVELGKGLSNVKHTGGKR